MNRPIRTLGVLFLVMFLAMMGRATYVQFFAASALESISNHPGNLRVVNDQFSRQRGAILVGNTPIAQSVVSNDGLKFQRVYSAGPEFAQLTGFFTRDWGLGGLESSQNGALAGTDDRLFLKRLVDLIDNKPHQGENLVLTINGAAQKAAFDGLQGKVGAVVAIEPSTGKILAMASTPSFDPNTLATHQFDTVGSTKNGLLQQKPSPLNNIGIQTVVPPGSTFKLVTLAAALGTGRYAPDTPVPGAASMPLPLSNNVLHNEDNQTCGAKMVPLVTALARSCNVAFGTVGADVGAAAIAAQAAKFGFGQTYFHDLDDPLVRQAPSRFPTSPDAPQTILASIGQGDVAATPLQMALVAAGIANAGTVMKPYLISEVDYADLSVASRTKPEQLNNQQPAVTPQVAQTMTQMMEQVVQSGTGTPAQIPGVLVAGKTGTAQSDANRAPYAWFVSFAPADNPQVAVAVLIQDAAVDRNAVSGGGLAAPIAREVMRAVIGK